jgi:hypothetical protein
MERTSNQMRQPAMDCKSARVSRTKVRILPPAPLASFSFLNCILSQHLMNVLNYQATEDNRLSFQLLVDGQLLSSLIGAKDSAIPYWLWLKEVPQNGTGKAIVTVCSCGEYGCGCTLCDIDLTPQEAIFHDFDFDVSSEGRKKRFIFLRENFESVMAEIKAKANEFAEKNGEHW